MTDQLSLLGMELSPRRLEAQFLCIMPDALTGQGIYRLGGRLRSGNALTGRLIGLERLHVSLQSVMLSTPLQTLVQACGRVRFPAFDLCLNKIGSFTNSRQAKPFVLWVDEGRDELLALRMALHRELSRDVRPKPQLDNLATPHLTLLYDRRMVPEYPILPIRWRVRDFVLVRSFVGQGRYEILGRWPLEAE